MKKTMKAQLLLAVIGASLSVQPLLAAVPKINAPAPASAKKRPCNIPVIKKAWFCNASQTSQKYAPQPVQSARPAQR